MSIKMSIPFKIEGDVDAIPPVTSTVTLEEAVAIVTGDPDVAGVTTDARVVDGACLGLCVLGVVGEVVAVVRVVVLSVVLVVRVGLLVDAVTVVVASVVSALSSDASTHLLPSNVLPVGQVQEALGVSPFLTRTQGPDGHGLGWQGLSVKSLGHSKL